MYCLHGNDKIKLNARNRKLITLALQLGRVTYSASLTNLSSVPFMFNGQRLDITLAGGAENEAQHQKIVEMINLMSVMLSFLSDKNQKYLHFSNTGIATILYYTLNSLKNSLADFLSDDAMTRLDVMVARTKKNADLKF